MRCDYEKREVIRYRLSFARLSCASGGLWQLIKQVKIIQGAKIVLDRSCRTGPAGRPRGVTPLYYTNEATLVKTSVKSVVFNGAGSPYNFKESYIK